MSIKKKPFTRYKLDQEKDQEKREVFSVSINKKERAWLNELKEDLNIKSDGTALKIAALIGKNVTQAIFGKKLLRYLFKKERAKLEDIDKF